MPDDKAQRDYKDKTRINTKQPHEVQYWKKALDVTGQQLAGAVRAVGTSVARVKVYLQMKKGKK